MKQNEALLFCDVFIGCLPVIEIVSDTRKIIVVVYTSFGGVLCSTLFY